MFWRKNITTSYIRNTRIFQFLDIFVFTLEYNYLLVVAFKYKDHGHFIRIAKYSSKVLSFFNHINKKCKKRETYFAHLMTSPLFNCFYSFVNCKCFEKKKMEISKEYESKENCRYGQNVKNYE